MIKKRYFTISKKDRYGMNEPIFRFENLEGAMEMFKYLMSGKSIEIDHIDVPDNKETPDKDGYVSSEYLNVEVGENEYHLGSENIDIYTKEEAQQIKKERDAWLEPFKKKDKK